MPKVSKFTRAPQDTGMVPGQELAGEDSFRSPNQAGLNRLKSEQSLQAWKGSFGAGRNDGKSDP